MGYTTQKSREGDWMLIGPDGQPIRTHYGICFWPYRWSAHVWASENGLTLAESEYNS